MTGSGFQGATLLLRPYKLWLLRDPAQKDRKHAEIGFLGIYKSGFCSCRIPFIPAMADRWGIDSSLRRNQKKISVTMTKQGTRNIKVYFNM